jgi:hypothetical protein
LPGISGARHRGMTVRDLDAQLGDLVQVLDDLVHALAVVAESHWTVWRRI